MLFVAYLGCTPVFDQVQQIYPMLYNPSQDKTSYTKSYPHKYTYKDTHKDTHTIRGIQVHLHSAIHTNTRSNLRHKYAHKKRPQIHLQLNYSVHVTMLHGNMVITPTNTPTNTLYCLQQYRCSHKRGRPPPGGGEGGASSNIDEGGGGVHRGRELGCPLGELPLHQGKGPPA